MRVVAVTRNTKIDNQKEEEVLIHEKRWRRHQIEREYKRDGKDGKKKKFFFFLPGPNRKEMECTNRVRKKIKGQRRSKEQRRI